MKVLIGCEESGVIRKEFSLQGHEAISCDLLPTREPNHGSHHQGDIKTFLNSFQDSELDLCILHPDCTKVAVCGNKTWAGTQARLDEINWILDLWLLAKTKSKRVALENPMSVIWPALRALGAKVQFVQPYEHGHPEQKKTGLALHNLPKLEPSKWVYTTMQQLPKHERERIHYMSPSETRKRDRSVTFLGIAKAMTDQWGIL